MANGSPPGEIHVGRNIDALQRQLGVTDEEMLEALGLSYNRLWDMKRRDWAQKRTIDQVAAALTRISGVPVAPLHVLTGRLDPERFASLAIEAFVRLASELDDPGPAANGGIRLPLLEPEGARLDANDLPPGEPAEVIRAAPGDFVLVATGRAMEPTIIAGDRLVGVRATAAADGDLVVASFAVAPGEWQFGVRRLRRDGERPILASDNLSADAFGRRVYPDVCPAELRIHGIVVGIWRALVDPARQDVA